MSSSALQPSEERLSAFLYGLPIVAAVLMFMVLSPHSLSHDDSWFLVATRKFLDGYQLYVDIVEVNPPLNFYLTVPALWLADGFGMSDTLGLIAFSSTLCALSGLWCIRLLSLSDLPLMAKRGLAVAAVTGVSIMPVSEWAQREHFLLIFATPYFLHEILGEKRIALSQWERVGIGIVAAVGIGLKPHFALFPAAIVLVGPVSQLFRRAFSPANLGLACGLLAFALFTIFVHPAFFSDILVTAGQVYSVYGARIDRVFLRQEFLALFGVLFLYRTLRQPGEAGQTRFAASICAAIVVYFIQFKGWDYHLLPLMHFILLGSTYFVLTATPNTVRFLQKTVFAAIFVMTIGLFVGQGHYRARNIENFTPFFEGPGETVMVYSTNVHASFPLTNVARAKWASRFPAQWTIPGAVVALEGADCASEAARCLRMEGILDRAREANTEDFLRYRPDLVFVDVRPDKSYFKGLPFDYIDFQSEDPLFAAAWENYTRVGMAGEDYEVWRRRAGQGQ